MASIHGGRVIVRQLKEEGVDALFTLTGGHISAIYDGVRQEGGIRVVDVRHEQAAAHAADGYARLTRSVGACAVTAGPGLTDAITGLANASYAGSPVVCFAGRNPLTLENMGALQDAPQLELVRPVARRVETLLETRRAAEITALAVRAALTPRMGPALVDCPMDVIMGWVEEEQVVAGDARRATHGPGADPDAVATVADLLAAAEHPVVLSGSQTYWDGAEEELRELVEAGRLPLFVNSMSRGILPSTHPNLLATGRGRALADADVVLALGIDFDFRLGYGQGLHPDARVVHVDPQVDKLGGTRQVEVGIPADIRLFLRALLEQAGKFARSEDSAWLSGLQAAAARKREEQRAAIDDDRVPIHPMRFAAEVARFADHDAVLIGDGGDIVAVTAGVAQADRPGHWMDPGPFGCLGVGAPFAMAARLAKPDAQVVVVFGDGSFGFNGFEYESAARQGLPFVGIIGTDGAWGEMRTFQEAAYGPEGLIAQELSQETRYERVVEGLGGYGERVERPGDIAPALARAQDSGVPAVVNVILDPTFRRMSGTAYG